MSKSKKQNNCWFFLPFFLLFFFIFFLFRGRSFDSFESTKPPKELEFLNPRQKKILEILSNRGEVTTEELLGEIGVVTERTLRRDMKKFEQLGLSEKQGSTKGSKYIYTK